MDDKIKKQVTSFVHEDTKQKFEVGDILIDDRGYIYIIKKINEEGYATFHYYDPKKGEGRHYSGVDLNRPHGHREYIILGKKIPTDFENQILDKVKNVEQFVEEEPKESSSTALAKMDKNFLVARKKEIEAKKREIQIMNRMLEAKRDRLYSIVRSFEKQIGKIQKVIDVIELYLGLKEDVVQFREGSKAPENTPLTFRQGFIYMDEEVAVDLDFEGGLDWKDIDKFDEWLIENDNYLKIIPEEKCVVICVPRRFDKDYPQLDGIWGAITKGKWNAWNKVKYVLIRNGENLYRIASENLEISTNNFFPSEQEMSKLIKVSHEGGDWFSDQENARNTLFDYRKCLIIMQGLIDRSEILHPFPHMIKLDKPETWGKIIQFIYDDSMVLSEGRMPYQEWQKIINNQIVRGTRVLFPGFTWRDTHKDYGPDRYPYYVSRGPDAGIYNIKTVSEGNKYVYWEKRFNCNYKQSGDDVWDPNKWGFRERKMATPFYLYPDDYMILNYDLLTIADIDFYLHNRVDRKHYVEMIPTLKWARKMKMQELMEEANFIELLRTKFPGVSVKKIQDAIEWWKMRVIYKRPLMREDAKALRMISGKLRREKI